MILGYFKWKLNFPTASLFCEVWSKFSIWRSDLMMGTEIDNFELVLQRFNSYVDYFLAVSLQVRILSLMALTFFTECHCQDFQTALIRR